MGAGDSDAVKEGQRTCVCLWGGLGVECVEHQGVCVGSCLEVQGEGKDRSGCRCPDVLSMSGNLRVSQKGAGPRPTSLPDSVYPSPRLVRTMVFWINYLSALAVSWSSKAGKQNYSMNAAMRG